MSHASSAWREQRLVESFEADNLGRLKPHMLLAYLLNSAWRHAQDSDYGFQPLSSRNLMWVLAKVELRVMRLPAWGEQIAIETWGKGIDRFYALRDFAVHSTDGRKIASSASAWMILDKSSYRPQKLEQIKMDFPWVPGRHEIETELKKVPPVGSDVERSRFDVRYTDLDVNKHVTAARYLQWMLDSYPTAELEAHEPRSIEINYLAEARMGDQVSVCYERQQGFDLCVVSRALDHKELCRARIEWTSS